MSDQGRTVDITSPEAPIPMEVELVSSVSEEDNDGSSIMELKISKNVLFKEYQTKAFFNYMSSLKELPIKRKKTLIILQEDYEKFLQRHGTSENVDIWNIWQYLKSLNESSTKQNVEVFQETMEATPFSSPMFHRCKRPRLAINYPPETKSDQHNKN